MPTRWQDKDFHEIVGGRFFQLLRALPVNVEHDIAASRERLFDGPFWCPVVIIEDFGVFQKLALVAHHTKILGGEEMIVLALFLARARLTGGGGNRHGDLAVTLKQPPR